MDAPRTLRRFRWLALLACAASTLGCGNSLCPGLCFAANDAGACAVHRAVCCSGTPACAGWYMNGGAGGLVGTALVADFDAGHCEQIPAPQCR